MSIASAGVDLDGPPPELKFRRRVPLREALQDLWAARALVLTVAERDLRVRYKQAFLGFAWAIVNPVVLLVAFTIIFEHAAHVSTNGTPYPLFSYLGLLPWTFFSSSVSSGSSSIVVEKSLLNKVHFPREAFPLADCVVATVDLAMATVAFVALFAIEQFVPRATIYWVPLYLPIIAAFTIGVTLALAGMMVYFRDLRQVVPIILQLGLFATPVAYSFSIIPKNWQAAYAALNPLGPVIDDLRRAILLGHGPIALPLVVAAASSLVYLLVGYKLFKRMEMGFADIA